MLVKALAAKGLNPRTAGGVGFLGHINAFQSLGSSGSNAWQKAQSFAGSTPPAHIRSTTGGTGYSIEKAQ